MGKCKKVNGNFLLALFAGIFLSIISLAKLIEGLLESHPILIWSFFFGLIIASIYFVGKQITKWDLATVLSLIFGVAIAYFITTIPSSANNDSPIFLKELALKTYCPNLISMKREFLLKKGFKANIELSYKTMLINQLQITNNHNQCNYQGSNSWVYCI